MKRRIRLGKFILFLLTIFTIATLIRDWKAQDSAQSQCGQFFGEIQPNDGYILIDFLGPDPSTDYFKTRVFISYLNKQAPSKISLTRSAVGSNGPEGITGTFGPFGSGVAAGYMDMILPTPGVSQKHFPFDSPLFDFTLTFDPPIRPIGVVFRNANDDYIQDCSAFSYAWMEPSKLLVKTSFIRNPFIRSIVVIIGLAALCFGLLLGKIRESDKLSAATASYFFSVWSVRNIVVPLGLPHPTLLDFWLIFVGILVLFVVAWRLLSIVGESKA